MKSNENDHGAGTPVVKAMNEPSEGYFHTHVIEAVITAVNGRNKIEELPHTRDDLKKKDHQDATAKNIRKTCTPGHFFLKADPNQLVERPAIINPLTYFLKHQRVPLDRDRFSSFSRISRARRAAQGTSTFIS